MMMGDEKNLLEFMVRREEWATGVSLYVRQITEGMGPTIAQPLIFKQYNQNMIIDPILNIGIQEAQNLIDELWQCGLRPSEGTGSAGSLRATEKHLEDMRCIVGKKLNISL